MSTLVAPDGLAVLRAVADAARTPEGHRLVGELAAEVRGALTDDGIAPRRPGGNRPAGGAR